MTDEKATAHHWLVVGYVSPGAKKWIEGVGGRVIHLSSDPPLVAVALAYNPDGTWVWSHGRREHRQGIEFWTTGEIQEASTGITLQYDNFDTHQSAEYASVVDNYLCLPDETMDAQTRQVVTASEAHQEGTESVPSPNTTDAAPDLDDLGDLDEAPF